MKIPSLLALTVTLALGTYPVNVWAELNENIRLSFDKGDFTTAFDLVEQALENNSEDQKLLLAKGYLLVKLNQLDAAAAYYQTLKTRLNSNPEPSNNLAMVYRMQKKYDQAIELFEQTIKQFPDYAHAYENLGDTYIELAHNQYQAGFDTSGHNLLKKKINLTQNFHQIAVQASPKLRQPDHRENKLPQANASPSGDSPVQETTAENSQQSDGLQTAVLNTLDAWLKDWMSLDPERYLSHYSSKFSPNNHASVEQWIAQKKQILATAGQINLNLSDIIIQFEQDNIAVANFTQEYESKSFKDTTNKTLRLENDQGRWLILEEVSDN